METKAVINQKRLGLAWDKAEERVLRVCEIGKGRNQANIRVLL
jgi:hypothetical protein